MVLYFVTQGKRVIMSDTNTMEIMFLLGGKSRQLNTRIPGNLMDAVSAQLEIDNLDKSEAVKALLIMYARGDVKLTIPARSGGTKGKKARSQK